ncbi:unnamed protein product [Rotaria sordida]|uniref:F-box domain-containing protein n=1 Tax=Rotaria sordida TaxID=392033 RepID=A0A815SG94_9BILA|nr:unnamed protein product [Rotaria sordida]
MTCPSNTKNLVELLDLPDEIILAIMNKIKPRPMLLYSMIGIKNIRLEQLALEQCHSIDLTSDCFDSSYEMFIYEFISFTLPCIFNYIKSLTIDNVHVQHLGETRHKLFDWFFFKYGSTDNIQMKDEQFEAKDFNNSLFVVFLH